MVQINSINHTLFQIVLNLAIKSIFRVFNTKKRKKIANLEKKRSNVYYLSIQCSELVFENTMRKFDI